MPSRRSHKRKFPTTPLGGGGEGRFNQKCRLKPQGLIFCNSNVYTPQLIEYVHLIKLSVKKQMLILLRASQMFTPKDFEQKL